MRCASVWCYQSCRSWSPVLGLVKDRESSFPLFFPPVLLPTWPDGPRGRLSVTGTELQMDGSVFFLHPIRFHCFRLCLCPLAVEQWQWARVCSVVRFPPSRLLSLTLSLPSSPTRSLICSSPRATLLSLSLFYTLFFSLALIFLSSLSFSLYYHTLCISDRLLLTFSPCISPFLPCFPLSRLGHEDGYSPSSSTQPLLAVLGKRLETSSAHAGLRSSHKHCFQDQRGRETNRA